MSRRQHRGSALVLIAIILAGTMAALLLAGPWQLSRNKNDQRVGTTNAFSTVHEALVNFVLLNSRLPCPANGTQTTGLEHVAVDTFTCGSPTGPAPWTTLGLPRTAVLDGYGRLISYRVYDGSSGFVRASGFALANCLEQDDTTVVALDSGACNSTTHENTPGDFLNGKGLTVSDRGTSKTTIAYVLISHGPTGYGAWLDNATSMTAPTSGSKEQVNASSSTTYWILEENSSTVAATDVSHFDDLVAYRTARDLLVSARQSGRPWQLSTSTDYTMINSLDTAASTATYTGNAMTIRASGTLARYICRYNKTPEGIGACLVAGSTNDGINNLSSEYLEFEFRVKRRHFLARLTDYRSSGPNHELATFTFFNGSTQVYTTTKSSSGCNSDANVGVRYTINAGADFTKVRVSTSDSGSEFGISAVSACNSSDSSSCYARTTTGAKDTTSTDKTCS